MNKPNFSYFEQFTNFEKRRGKKSDFKLDNMRALLEDFHNPHEQISYIHVAGSKGKGQSAAFIAAILSDFLGEAVGIYSSPHVYDYRERIRAALPGMENYRDGFFHDDIYAWGIETIIAYQESANRENSPTTFELLTLLAFLIFRKQNLSWAVIEVGLGGRLDSTNVIHPELSVITPLEIEHSQYLGNSIAEIAWEKAGIIKAAVPVLSQGQAQEAQEVIAKRAEDLGSPCYFYDQHAQMSLCTGHAEAEEFRSAIKSSVSYVRENACLAYSACCILLDSAKDRLLPPRPAAASINRTHLPGRFELRHISPPGKAAPPKCVVLDAAHTPASIDALLSGLAQMRKMREYDSNKTLTVIFSALEDKNYESMLEKIIPVCDNLVITASGNFKRANVEKLKACALRLSASLRGAEIVINHDPAAAFLEEIANSRHNIIVVCGSFYLLAEIYKALEGLEEETVEP